MSERRSGWVGGHLMPLLVAVLFLLPLLWMITASLRGPGLAPPTTIEWLPPSATIENYGTVFELLPFGRIFHQHRVGVVDVDEDFPGPGR